MSYDALRHIADSWVLVVMALVFCGLCLWPFRPGAKPDAENAATMIFEDEDNG